MKHGAGSIVVKMLGGRGINKIVAGELSPGVSALLEQFNIDKNQVKRNSPIRELVRNLTS